MDLGPRVTTSKTSESFVDNALGQVKAGTAVVWVTRCKSNGKVAGTTRFYEISHEHHTMELGWTWLHPNYHRTGINVEAKYLQLTHAFERMIAMRVALKTHQDDLIANRDRRHRREVRGCLSQSHDYARRQHPPQPLVQHRPRRIAPEAKRISKPA